MSITHACHKVYTAHIQRRPKVGKTAPSKLFHPEIPSDLLGDLFLPSRSLFRQ